MESNKLKALQALQQNMPIANQNVANQFRAANDIQLQQSIAQTPRNVPTRQAANQLGGAVAQQAGQQQVQRNQVEVQQAQQVAGQALQAQDTQNQVRNQTIQRETQERQFQGQQRLARVSEAAKQEVFDSRLKITQANQEFEFLNTRNLADFAILRGVTDQQFQDYQQASEQAYDRSIQIMQHSYDLLRAEMQRAHQAGEQEKAQELEKHLLELQRDAQDKAEKKSAFGNIISSVLQVGGAVAGGIVGAAGGPAGAAVGASIGGSIGGAVGGAASAAVQS